MNSVRTMRLKQVIVGVGLVGLALMAVIAYVLWEDGKQFAAGQINHMPEPSGVTNPTYLDVSRFQWQTAEKLQQYVLEHQKASVQQLEAQSKP
jgi:hypothetical protein